MKALLLAAALTGLGASAGAAQERPWTPLPVAAPARCPDGLCQPESLERFSRALDDPRGRPVRIVVLGDSHTAGGWITGGLLRRLREMRPGRDIQLVADGVVSSTLARIDRRPAALPDNLDREPDLVIVAFGTNEGFDDDFDPAAYQAVLERQVGRLRAEAPGAAILLLGAPEALRSEGAYGRACPGDQEQRWAAPTMLAVVRGVQYRTAARLRIGFWDWYGRMGGACSAYRLSTGVEPLMRGDHVHFTETGGDWIGGLLFDDMMTARRAQGGR